MSNDIQLSSRQQLMLQPDDPFGGPPAPGPEDNNGPSMFTRVHRLLRGRYIIVIVFALLFAGAGAYLGYASQKPEYRSVGYIRIRPTLNDVDLDERVQPMYSTFMKTQALLITDRRVVKRAVESKKWRELGRGSSEWVVNALQANLDAKFIGGSTLISVTYIDTERDAAQAAVNEVIEAYMTLIAPAEIEEAKRKKQIIDAERTKVGNRIRNMEAQKAEIAKFAGGLEVHALHAAKRDNILRNQLRLSDTEFALRMAYNAHAGIKADPKVVADIPIDKIVQEVLNLRTDPKAVKRLKPLSLAEAVQRSPEIARLTADREKLQSDRVVMLRRMGENHPRIKDMDARIDELQRRINGEVTSLEEEMTATLHDPEAGAQQIDKNDLIQFALRYHYLKQLVEREEVAVQRLYNDRIRVDALNMQLRREGAKAEELDRRSEELAFTAEIDLVDRIAPLKASKPVAPVTDRRSKYAVVFGVGGFLAPLALGLLWGLMDRRYRYSDDADVSGVQLLGILPNLPDRMTDPNQASVAAHCVHQIRTMLQVGGGGPRSVFTVTSASPGDGKTSLSLALGLSFAAAGMRSLIIDADVVGGGLSARMNVTSADGILEALVNRSLLEYVRTTDVPDLAILPVGSARAQHAPAFSPAAVNRLIAEARKHFDAVVIDSGPILGSIEASPACVAADAAVLVVARGQQRSLVQRALKHLKTIGARTAGVVFNRAQPNDFAQSVSRFSRPLLPPLERERAAAMDPVTQAVVSHGETGEGSVGGNGEVNQSNGESNREGY